MKLTNLLILAALSAPALFATARADSVISATTPPPATTSAGPTPPKLDPCLHC